MPLIKINYITLLKKMQVQMRCFFDIELYSCHIVHYFINNALYAIV